MISLSLSLTTTSFVTTNIYRYEKTSTWNRVLPDELQFLN